MKNPLDHVSNHHHGCKIKSTQLHEDLLDTPHFIWLFWEVVGWKTFFSLVNWKVCCILWSWWQQNNLHSAAFKRHHLFWKSPVEFVPWTDEDIIICRNIFSKKVKPCWLTSFSNLYNKNLLYSDSSSRILIKLENLKNFG